MEIEDGVRGSRMWESWTSKGRVIGGKERDIVEEIKVRETSYDKIVPSDGLELLAKKGILLPLESVIPTLFSHDILPESNSGYPYVVVDLDL